MIRLITATLGLTALILLTVATEDCLARYGGRAVMRESGFDFGKTPQESKVTKKFFIVNEGTDTLRIIDIKPG
jgi:hypothetical protein